MNHSIDDIISIGYHKYKCTKASNLHKLICKECDLKNILYADACKIILGNCLYSKRQDKTNVIFKLLK